MNEKTRKLLLHCLIGLGMSLALSACSRVALSDLHGRAYKTVFGIQTQERLSKDAKGFDGQDAVLTMTRYRAIMGSDEVFPKTKTRTGKEALNIQPAGKAGFGPRP